jgi:hypothetical protein
LIDDVSIVAVLLTDAGDPLALPKTETDDSVVASACLAAAQKLAAHENAIVGRQTNSVVFIQHPAAAEMSFGCAHYGLKPDVYIAWDGHARPPVATGALIVSAGEFLAGATLEEMKQELAKCVTQALSPDAGELADREFRGVRIECQAFTRDGGGGSVTVYRRFGATTAGNQMLASIAWAPIAISRLRAGDGDRTAGRRWRSACDRSRCRGT